MLDPKTVAQEFFETNPRAAKGDVEQFARSKLQDDEFVLQVYVHYFLLRGERPASKKNS